MYAYCYVCSVLGNVSLCWFVYYLCVNVYCTTATGCQPNCSSQICHILHVSEGQAIFIFVEFFCS